MKISYVQLQKHLDTRASLEIIIDVLTEIGLEVGKIERLPSISEKLKGVIVGEVLTCISHPNADRLKITTVDIGRDQPLNIVCGAPNVAQEKRVAVATVGTSLSTNDRPFKIKKSKIRGVVSEGMLCSEQELGIGTDDEGIVLLDDTYSKGKSISDYFDTPQDTILEIDITPNRSDAISHFGVARDLYAALRSRDIPSILHKLPEPLKPEASLRKENTPIIKVHNPEKCTRYSGIVLSGLQIKPSPKWLQNFLISLGQRPINNVVDITNYVMMDLGQPLHAFDYDKIQGHEIHIRTARKGETITTINHKEINLHREDLVIADRQNPMCIAGVIGGKDSGVSEKTHTIFLESAHFNPTTVRKTSKRIQTKTESSYRYERGICPTLTLKALRKAVELILDLAGGTVLSGCTDNYPHPVKDHQVSLRFKALNTIFGDVFPKEKLHSILSDLEITIIKETDTDMDLFVPVFRLDTTREIDVIEDVLRIYGYNNIPTPDQFRFKPALENVSELPEKMIRHHLSSLGYNEVMTSSFIPPKNPGWADGFDQEKRIPIQNALHGNCTMRYTLRYNLLEVAANHSRRGRKNVKIFEFGTVYQKQHQGYLENRNLTLLLSGEDLEKNWMTHPEGVTFAHVNGIVSSILWKLGLQITDFKHSKEIPPHEVFKHGISWGMVAEKPIISIAKIYSDVLRHFDMDTHSFLAEIDWNALENISATQKNKYREFSNFPVVQRALSLIIDQSTPFGALYNTAFDTVPKHLSSVNLFDCYRGNSLGSEKKSYGLSFFLEKKNGTFKDSEIQRIMTSLTKAFEARHGAVVRSS